MTITYRTAGPWGAGLGADLSANQVDNNFYGLATAVADLQAAGIGAGIDSFVVVGNQFFVHLDNHQVLGPYTLPQANWDFQGPWAPNTFYGANSVVTNNGAVYLVLQPITSAATFNPSATSSGNPIYGLLLAEPADILPEGGTVGQVLTQGPADSPGNTLWTTLTRNLCLYIEGQPTANELVLQYVTPEEMTLPAGLEGSVAVAGQLNTNIALFGLYQNGNAIGSIEFGVSPHGEVLFAFSTNTTFQPGDILTIIAPSSVDATLANISFTIQALLP